MDICLDDTGSAGEGWSSSYYVCLWPFGVGRLALLFSFWRNTQLHGNVGKLSPFAVLSVRRRRSRGTAVVDIGMTVDNHPINDLHRFAIDNCALNRAVKMICPIHE